MLVIYLLVIITLIVIISIMLAIVSIILIVKNSIVISQEVLYSGHWSGQKRGKDQGRPGPDDYPLEEIIMNIILWIKIIMRIILTRNCSARVRAVRAE